MLSLRMDATRPEPADQIRENSDLTKIIANTTYLASHCSFKTTYSAVDASEWFPLSPMYK
jgi:hypothetical protein